MSRKILLTTTAIALAAGLTAAQAQSNSQDRLRNERMQNSQSQDATQSGTSQQNSTQQNERINSSADRAQNVQKPASPSGSSAQNRSQPNANAAQATPPAGSQTGNNATTRSQNSSAQSVSPSSNRSSANSASTSGRSAESSSASVKLSEQQRTRVAASISAQKIAPATNVNFSISVGTRVPRTVQLHTVSADIVSIVPQYRGYSYFVTSNQIVIVEPRTSEIVTILPYGGSERAEATPPSRKAMKFSNTQRQTIRKQIVARPARTTVTQTREITVGDEVPDTIILEEMPQAVYTEVPGARPYRYYRTDRDVVIVDPTDRHVVDVLD